MALPGWPRVSVFLVIVIQVVKLGAIGRRAILSLLPSLGAVEETRHPLALHRPQVPLPDPDGQTHGCPSSSARAPVKPGRANKSDS